MPEDNKYKRNWSMTFLPLPESNGKGRLFNSIDGSNEPLPGASIATQDSLRTERMLDYLIEEKGGKRDDYKNIMNTIAYHESKYLDGKEYVHLDPKAVQDNKGPGRGLYMFEKNNPLVKSQRGAKTALNRTRTVLKRIGEDIPQWMNDFDKTKDYDASKLTKHQQDLLFLGNYREHPDANLKNVIDGKQTIKISMRIKLNTINLKIKNNI